MPSAAGYTWPDELDAIIRRESHSAGVPIAWSYAIIGAESGFNPNAGNESDIESSHGLLQLNRSGGQGTGYTVQTLRDPTTNLRIGLPYIARALTDAAAVTGNLHDVVWYVSVRSGHPGPVTKDDPRVLAILRNYEGFMAAFPESSPAPPPPAAVPPVGALPSDQAIRALVAATFILSVGHPLSDLSPDDRTALRYVVSLLP